MCYQSLSAVLMKFKISPGAFFEKVNDLLSEEVFPVEDFSRLEI